MKIYSNILKINNNNLSIRSIKKWCDECDGSGDISSCCGGGVDENKCELCGKFCKIYSCDNCCGQGYNIYTVGDNVEIYISAYSNEYLLDMLYKPKNINDCKIFSGKIIRILKNNMIEIKIKRKIIQINIEDIY